MSQTHVFSGFSVVSAGAAASAALAQAGSGLSVGGGEVHVSIVDVVEEPGGGFRAVVKVVFDDAGDVPSLMRYPGEIQEEDEEDSAAFLLYGVLYDPEADFFAATHPANDYEIPEVPPADAYVPSLKQSLGRGWHPGMPGYDMAA